jgi:hypothetical protein
MDTGHQTHYEKRSISGDNTNMISVSSPSGLTRPPRMSVGVQTSNFYESPAVQSVPVTPVIVQPAAPEPKPAPKADIKIESASKPEIQRILESAGFTLGSPPKIAGVQLDIWALNGEELNIGIVTGAHGRITAKEGGGMWSSDIDGEFKSPAAELYSVLETLKALFAETLDAGMNINMNAFVVCPDGNIENFEKLESVWNAFGVRVFSHGIPELQAFVSDMEIHPKNDSFIEYMNTILWYYSDEGAK